jgi:hypothetical protein
MVDGTGAVFEAKFMLPWSFSEEAAAEKHMAQLQHNMWVTNAKAAALSIITGGGKWVEISIPADWRSTLEVVRQAFERAGVEFIDENGGGAGLRLRKPPQGKPRK